uniref:Uncharacterized protein n=1 Tax=Siphoviridae sp. ctzWr28 TaxID=2827980 RepID=A0A8S5SCI4_9CAUD|nr:MAG TPA: hypothetical protein [Siphoviridae sp. ctzWr28]
MCCNNVLLALFRVLFLFPYFFLLLLHLSGYNMITTHKSSMKGVMFMFSAIAANFLYLMLPGFIGRIIIDHFSYSKKHDNFYFFMKDISMFY